MYSAVFADDSHLRSLGGHGSGGGGGGRSLGSTQGFGPKTYDPYKLLSPNGNGVNVKSQANYARDIFGVIDFSQQVEKSNSTYSDFYNNPSKYEINPITGEPTGFGAIHPGDDPMYDAILFFAEIKATELVIMGVKQLAPKVMAALSTFYKGAEKPSSSIFSYIGKKIMNQFGSRNWTTELIHNVVNKPFTTREAFNKATGNAATAFFEKSGAYVVRDNITGEIIQISKRGDFGWVPDATIINPYSP